MSKSYRYKTSLLHWDSDYLHSDKIEYIVQVLYNTSVITEYTTLAGKQSMLWWFFSSGLRIVGWGNSWNLLLHYLQQLHYIAGWTQTNSANQIWVDLGCLYLNQFYDRNIRVISMTLASKIKAFQSVWVI